MSQLGVDLLRSDTGHYMQWPPAEDYPTAPIAAGAAPGRSWVAPAVAAPRSAWMPKTTRERVGTYVSLVNWLILLLLFCTFLLAKTLPVDAALTGSTATQSCAAHKTGCAPAP